MHGRPDVVGLQTKQQLEYLFIGFHPDGILAHVLLHPSVQLLLVVDKNAPVLHGGPVRLFKILRKSHFFLLLHWHVRPEIPGGNAQHAAELVNAVHGSPPVRPRDDEASLLHIHQISFPAELPAFLIQPAAGKPFRFHQRVKIRRNAQGSRQNFRRLPAGSLSKYFCKVRPKIPGRDFYRVRFLTAHPDRTFQSPFQIKFHDIVSLIFCLIRQLL